MNASQQPNLIASADRHAVVERHVQMLHQCASGIDGVLVVSVFHANPAGDKDAPGSVTHHQVGDVESMVAAIMAHQDVPGANVYVGLQVMRRGLGRGKRGTESDIAAVLGLVADMDSDTGKAAGELPLEPSYIIETSPGNGQPAWLFDRPLSVVEAKPIAAALRSATGSDAGTADVTHVWRVPGTLNWPNAKKLARGRAIGPADVSVAEEWAGDLVSVEGLTSALQPWWKARPSDNAPVMAGDLPDVTQLSLDDEMIELLAADGRPDRSAHAARVVEALAFRGRTLEQSVALVLERAGAWAERYPSEGAMRKDLERLWAKFGTEHAAAAEAGSKAVAKILAGMSVPANDNKPEPTPPKMHPAPYSTDAAGGLLSDISNWVTNTAILPVPELSLCSAIALVAGLFGGKALTPTEAGINVYITTLLDTAGGKGHPPKAIRRAAGLLGAAGVHAVTNGDHTSYAAIERTLRRSPSTAIVMDEFGLTLQDINAKHQNSVAASIRKFLLAVYDQSNSMFDGRIYASAETKKDAEPINGPALTVLGMTTFDTLYAGLSEASVADGFLNRFLFVTATGTGEPLKAPKLRRESSVPRDLIDALKLAIGAFPALPKDGKHIVSMDGDEDGDAYERWVEIFRWQNDPWWQGDARNIIGRAAENTIRLATIRAISRSPGSPVVAVDDVEWGWAIVYRSVQLIRDGVRRHMSASPAEALRKAIMEGVSDTLGGLTYSKLLERKGVRGSDSRQVADALQWLVDSGQVVDANAKPKPGKGSKFVRIS